MLGDLTMIRFTIQVILAYLGVVCPTQAQIYKQIYSFQNETDGSDVTSTLVRDSAGTFYGTSFAGGTSYGKACTYYGGCGTVLKIDARGKKSTLHNFGLRTKDGQNPYSGVILSKGALYGTTIYGGQSGYGTVFSMSLTGRQKVLHAFSGKTDGGYPQGGLVADGVGNLYGTAEYGGNMSGCSGHGCGTIFTIVSTGKFSVLYRFTGGTDGASPVASMIMDTTGNLYGTTAAGGSGCVSCGVVFELTNAGRLKVLHGFTGGTTDGEGPFAPVTRDSSGNLYGTTTFGGSQGIGTVFKIDSTGHEILLHSFRGSSSDGQYPAGGLIIDSGGRLYGAAPVGGKNSGAPGVIYELSPSGRETILYNFQGAPTDGREPDGALTPDGKGSLFGTAAIGGDGTCPIGCGTVFQLTP